jgi:exosortase
VFGNLSEKFSPCERFFCDRAIFLLVGKQRNSSRIGTRSNFALEQTAITKKHIIRYFLSSAGFGTGIAFFLIAYWNTLVWLWERAMAPDSYYSHAFLVPFVSAFLIWRERKTLRETPLKSSSWGLALILFSILIHLLGVLLNVYSTSGFSIPILMFGLSLFFFGWVATRKIVFPLAFLFFMIPLPMAALGTVSLPMKTFATESGARIAELFGVPVVREGFQLHFPSASLLIDNPCSGLRSLIALMALGSVYAYLFPASLWKRISLFLLAIPIALLANTVRVTILVLAVSRLGVDVIDGPLHWLSGLMVFVLALALLMAAGKLLHWRYGENKG